MLCRKMSNSRTRKYRTVKRIVQRHVEEMLVSDVDELAATQSPEHISPSVMESSCCICTGSILCDCEACYVTECDSHIRDDSFESNNDHFETCWHTDEQMSGNSEHGRHEADVEDWCESENESFDIDDQLTDEDLSMTYNDCETASANTFLQKFDEIAGELAVWGVKHRVRHTALKELLQILGKHHKLPKDPRTLLHTVRSISDLGLRKMQGFDGCEGEYVYFGLEKEFKRSLDTDFPKEIAVPPVISLLFNVDGLPLYKSSGKQFWPILGKVHKPNIIPDSIFTVAIFYGSSKPKSVDEYLRDFIQELIHLRQVGITFRSQHVKIEIAGFSCDAPARSFLKCIKGHTGYFGCEKCTTRGKSIDGRLTYPETDAERRTGASFKNQTQEEHHKGVSALIALDIDLIAAFPLDYMHLLCLGVMRKLIINWMRGSLQLRLSSSQIQMCCDRLSEFIPHVCTEFCRKPRSLFEIDRWKASELRNFLMYYGPLVLRSVLHDELYHHFMILFVAVRILASSTLAHMHAYAANLLNTFVLQLRKLYGETSLIYNMHNLIHLADDVIAFGPLDTFSCFPFENKLGCIKKQLRSGSKALAQFCYRKSESDWLPSVMLAKPVVMNTNSERGASLCGHQAYNCELADFDEHLEKVSVHGLSFDICKHADCYALTRSSDVVKIQNMYRNKVSGKVALHCKQFLVSEDFFTYPCDSDTLQILKVSKLSSSCCVLNAEDVQAKCMLLPWKGYHVAMPLIHC